MRKNHKPKEPIMKILIAVQVFLVFAFVFVIANNASPSWKLSENAGVINVNSSGGGGSVKTYQIRQSLVDKTAEWLNGSGKSSDSAIAREYINSQLESITFSYIKEYNCGGNVSYEVLSCTKDDFRFEINGAPSGENWQVFVCLADSNNPQIAVYKGEQ